MASRTRSRVLSRTFCSPFTTRETVIGETPAWLATSAMVATFLPRPALVRALTVALPFPCHQYVPLTSDKGNRMRPGCPRRASTLFNRARALELPARPQDVGPSRVIQRECRVLELEVRALRLARHVLDVERELRPEVARLSQHLAEIDGRRQVHLLVVVDEQRRIRDAVLVGGGDLA